MERLESFVAESLLRRLHQLDDAAPASTSFSGAAGAVGHVNFGSSSFIALQAEL